MTTLSRRALLGALPAAAGGTILATPAIALGVQLAARDVPSEARPLADRISDQADALSRLLDDYLGGRFRAIVEPHSAAASYALQLQWRGRSGDANLERALAVRAAALNGPPLSRWFFIGRTAAADVAFYLDNTMPAGEWRS